MNSSQGCMSANNASQIGNGEAVDSPVPTQPPIQNKPSYVGASMTSCTMCGSEMHHKACCISCAICNRSVHVSCLTNQYKSSNTSVASQKNSLDWLKGLLLFAGFRFTCQLCRNVTTLTINNGNFMSIHVLGNPSIRL